MGDASSIRSLFERLAYAAAAKAMPIDAPTALLPAKKLEALPRFAVGTLPMMELLLAGKNTDNPDPAIDMVRTINHNLASLGSWEIKNRPQISSIPPPAAGIWVP